jgi:acyl carrier protein
MPVGLHLPDILILFIILLIFGSKKLPETGAAIGKSILAFKNGLSELDEKDEIQEQTLLEQKRSERETLERDLVRKKASASTLASAADHPQRQDHRKGTIYERLKIIIADQLGIDESKIVPCASFVEDLNADSLDLVELMMSLEEEFQLPIPDRDAKKITTVQEVEDYIKKRLD